MLLFGALQTDCLYKARMFSIELSPYYFITLQQAVLLVSATAHGRRHTVKEQIKGSALVTYHSNINGGYSPIITL